MSRHTLPTTALTCFRRSATPVPSSSRRFLSSSLTPLASSSSTPSTRPPPHEKVKETLSSILGDHGIPPPASDVKASTEYLLGKDTESTAEFLYDVENNRDNIFHAGKLIPPRQAYTLPQSTVAEPTTGLSSLGGRSSSDVVIGGGLGIPPRKDPLVDLMTNLMMKHGKKAEAEKRMSDILGLIQRSINSPPLPYLHRAIHLASPHLRLRTLRRSSKNIPLPTPLDARQSARTGILWILKAAERGRAGGLTRRSGRVAREVLGIVEWGVTEGRAGGSDALKRKEEVHRLGAVNRSNLNMRG